MDDIYIKLADHLDRLPGGFPRTAGGVEIRILERLFTPVEAAIAMALEMKLEKASAIADRLQYKPSELQPILDQMAQKGLIYRLGRDKHYKYMANQFVIGIWEYHVNQLNPELIRDFNEYAPHVINAQMKLDTRQLRVIPISRSLPANIEVMAYEQAEYLIQSQSKIAVASCICRKEHVILGEGCGKPIENCLVFGAGGHYYVDNGMGRFISRDEALEILHRGIEHDLVLQPSNAQKTVNICMCCGCCCQILKNIKSFDKPALFVTANFYARVSADDCNACGNCRRKCQMAAIYIEETAHINTDRCIGCGLCLTACDFNAISMCAKSEEYRRIPPANMFETWERILIERGKPPKG